MYTHWRLGCGYFLEAVRTSADPIHPELEFSKKDLFIHFFIHGFVISLHLITQTVVVFILAFICLYY